MDIWDVAIALMGIWIGGAFLIFATLWRFKHSDRYNWCCCGRHNLVDKEVHKTKNVIHRKYMCAPMREMIR